MSTPSYQHQADTSPGRRPHITRLPSSALLSSALKDSLSNQVRLVTFTLKESNPLWFVENWKEVTESSPASPSVVWGLFQEGDSDKVLHLIAQTVALPDDDKAGPRRQTSGMLNQRSTLESAISDWIARVQPSLDKPCSSNHLRIVLSSCDQLNTQSDQYTICLETIRVRAGLESGFTDFLIDTMSSGTKADACLQAAEDEEEPAADRVQAETSATTPLALHSAVEEECQVAFDYAVFQDINDTPTFRVMYYFRKQPHVLAVRESGAWIRWRRRVAAFISGAPRVCNLTKVLQSDGTQQVAQLGTPEAEQPTPGTKVTAHHTVEYTTTVSLEVADRAVSTDARLAPFRDYLRGRYERFLKKSAVLRDEDLANGRPSFNSATNAYKEFGVRRCQRNGVDGFVYREIVGGDPKGVFLYGDFNEWNRTSHPMSRVSDDPPVWEIFVADHDQEGSLQHLQKFKFLVVRQDGSHFDRMSPWTRLAREAEDLHVMDGLIWDETRKGLYTFQHPRPPIHKDKHPRVYEVHIGISSEAEAVGSYRETRTCVLPRLALGGFDTLLLVGVVEHASYPSCGWHTTAYFAPSSRFGTPDELKALVDEAHRLGIKVLLSVVYSHAGPNKLDGLGNIDETQTGVYFRAGAAGDQRRWDAKVFNYKSPVTARFLLSNMRYWLEEFMFDGFRFEGLESVLYKDHAVNDGFDRYDYSTYFNSNSDTDGAAFLMVANEVIHWVLPQAVTIGNCSAGSPTLATPLSKGGLGFDYTQSAHLPYRIMDVVEKGSRFQDFSLSALRFALDKMSSEKRLAAAETLETCVIAKRPMKIAFLAWETLHTIAVGGIAPHVTELAAALRRVGHEVHVYTRATGIANTVSLHYGVYYHEVTFHLDRDFIQECQNMCNAFVQAIQADEAASNHPYTLIHGHDWLVGRGVIALKGLNRTVVFTMHSTEVGRCGNQVFGGQSQRIRDIEASACNAADRVICVSGVLADEVKNFYRIHSEKIRVVYNGCNVHNFDGFEDAAPIKEHYGIKALEPTILFVGRFVVQKGVDLMLEAVPHILKFRDDVKFVIVGDGHMRMDVEARAKQLGVMHAMRFLGAKGGAELKSLYKMCDAVAVPSRNEPFGIVVLEAWSAYKPVIATTCGGPRDFVTPNVDGFLVDPNPSSIAWGCCEALKNFEHTRWMGEQGRMKAQDSFSWDTIGTQTRDIYYELTNRGDVTYGVTSKGDCTLAQRAMGAALYSHMQIFDEDVTIMNGLALLRMVQLATVALGSEAVLYTMGSDFSHPDWIDFPRPGNNFSQSKARIQWSLATRKNLKYKHMLLFTRLLLRLDEMLDLTSSSTDLFVSRCSEEDKVLAMERRGCLVVFNFHSHNNYQEYGLGHSIPATPGLKLIMSTDEFRFSGRGRIESNLGKVYPQGPPLDDRDFSITIDSLPSRSAMVFTNDQLMSMDRIDPDELIDKFFVQCPFLKSLE
eukprot:Gregarina_sp_Poly_1__11336@NODE_951_length_5575_cov_353_323348_g675_i0_p1_GENE_NODE_951_length_5575_cov_353_323348_g675_i0NODE_951_length_5575_cov_353_323348_g675_i0_p1_ORF_typecomplete_len1476_score198_93Glycos_transf_1/PF00534_20/2_4e03Glycos_transf_1/PF00534_20/3_4e42Glyco_trans_1_4/PF13692_6/3_1e29Glyco_transf_4/PF13439_6/3_3e26Glyco_transf_4/PF13439_6/5_9e03Glyco_transf_4/PF13439_6/6_7e03Alphaamylase/PF00128_24/5e23Glyco_trans_4_4/PF13579_6/3_6e03Glyco_trans_4_4/PF13579_6/2e18Glycogen_syn/P